MSPVVCRFSAAGSDDLTTRCGGRGRKPPRHEIASGGSAAAVPQADGRAASPYGDLDARLGRLMPGRDEWCGRFALKFG